MFTELNDLELAKLQAHMWDNLKAVTKHYGYEHEFSEEASQLYWDLEEEYLTRIGLFHRSDISV